MIPEISENESSNQEESKEIEGAHSLKLKKI
jgi:hypothetical protein